MGIDATGYLLGILTIGASMIAVRYRNMLLTLGTAIMWAVLMTFILANTVAGTNWQSMFILGAVAFMCAFALISFLGRSRNNRSFMDNIGNLSSREEKEVPPARRRGIMDLPPGDYQAYIHTRMQRRRR